MKRPVCGIVLVIILGELMVTVVEDWFWLIPYALLLIIIKSITKKRIGFFVMLFFFGIWGALNMKYDLSQQRQVEEILSEGQVCQAIGKVEGISRGKNGWKIILEQGKINQVNFDKLLICCKEEPRIFVGSNIVVEGKGKCFSEAANFGNFDTRKYYMSQEIFGMIQAKKLVGGRDDQDIFRETLWEIKKQFQKKLSLICPEKGFFKGKKAIYETMLLGDKTEMEEEIKALYSSSGIAHILAISSLHITLLGMFFYRLLRRKFRFTASASVALIVVLCFGMLSGMSVATIRALIMFFLKMLGEVLGRVYDGMTAISLAAILLLLENPLVLLHSGFQMSFLAVIAIVPVWSLFQKVVPVKMPLIKSMMFGLNVQWMMAPLIAYYYFELPSYAVFLNLLVVPMMGIVIVSGVLGILGCFGGVLLGKLLIFPGCLVLSVFTELCHMMQYFPAQSVIVGKPEIWKILLYYGLYLGVLVLAETVKKKKDSKEKQLETRIGKSGVDLFRKNNLHQQNQRMFAKIRVIVLVGELFVSLIIYFGQQEGFYVSFLDVGQGDGIVVHTENGRIITIDGGSSSVNAVGKNRIQPFLKAKGIEKIDLAIMTHADEDHINGLKELIQQSEDQGVCVETLVLPELEKPDSAYQELVHLAGKHHVKIRYIRAGVQWKIDGVSLHCLWPQKNLEEDRNDLSTVLSVTYQSFSMLLTGDISAEAEEQLELPQNHYSILKVAHHGSKYSTSEKFLERIHPKIAVISVGKGNRYGHPTQEVLERLETEGCQCFRTDIDGNSTFVVSKK